MSEMFYYRCKSKNCKESVIITKDKNLSINFINCKSCGGTTQEFKSETGSSNNESTIKFI